MKPQKLHDVHSAACNSGRVAQRSGLSSPWLSSTTFMNPVALWSRNKACFFPSPYLATPPLSTIHSRKIVSPFFNQLLILQYNLFHVTDITEERALKFFSAQQKMRSILVAWRHFVPFRSTPSPSFGDPHI